jgi:hypothetical protein
VLRRPIETTRLFGQFGDSFRIAGDTLISKKMTIDELKPWQEKTVVLHLYDGEVTTAKVDVVDAEYEDIIVSVLTSNRHYERPRELARFAIRAADIQRIDLAEV